MQRSPFVSFANHLVRLRSATQLELDTVAGAPKAIRFFFKYSPYVTNV